MIIKFRISCILAPYRLLVYCAAIDGSPTMMVSIAEALGTGYPG
jgi:hypothetical protein